MENRTFYATCSFTSSYRATFTRICEYNTTRFLKIPIERDEFTEQTETTFNACFELAGILSNGFLKIKEKLVHEKYTLRNRKKTARLPHTFIFDDLLARVWQYYAFDSRDFIGNRQRLGFRYSKFEYARGKYSARLISSNSRPTNGSTSCRCSLHIRSTRHVDTEVSPRYFIVIMYGLYVRNKIVIIMYIRAKGINDIHRAHAIFRIFFLTFKTFAFVLHAETAVRCSSLRRYNNANSTTVRMCARVVQTIK